MEPFSTADTPLTDLATDALARVAFAQRLAGEITAWKGAESLVIGLNGDPGSGKTTLKNFARHFLAAAADEPRAFAVVEFNPWKTSAAAGEPLPRRFCREAASQLAADSSRAPAAALAAAFAAGEKSAPAHDTLRTALAGLPQPLVVFVDDVDRLPGPAIHELLQFVKAAAELPNVVWVLLYHRRVVAAALDEGAPGSAADALRKIVQLELELPEPPEPLLRKLLETGLDQILAPAEFPLRPRDRWNDAFMDAVWPFFTNPRDAKRFLNVLRFYFATHFHAGLRVLEVNPIDLVLLETVRMFAHSAYAQLRETFRRRETRVVRGLFGHDEDRKEARFEIERVVAESGLSPRLQRALRSALQHLLPQAGGGGQGVSEDWDRDLRLCSPRHAERYFHLGAVPVAVPAHRLVEIVRATEDREKMEAMLVQASADGVLPEVIERLPRLLQRLTILQLAAAARAMCGLCDQIPASAPADLESQLIKIAADLIGQLKTAVQRETVLSDMLEDPKRLTGPILLFHQLRPRSDGSAAPSGTPLSVEQFRRLVKPAVEKLRASAFAGEIWRSREYGALIRRWWEWADDKDDVRQWLASEVKQPERARAWLRTFVNANTSAQGKEFFLHIDEIGAFCDLTLIAAPAAQATGDVVDQAAAKKLQAALTQRNTTPPGGRRLALVAVDPEGNVIR